MWRRPDVSDAELGGRVPVHRVDAHAPGRTPSSGSTSPPPPHPPTPRCAVRPSSPPTTLPFLLPHPPPPTRRRTVRSAHDWASTHTPPAFARGHGADAARWDEPGYAVLGIEAGRGVALAPSSGHAIVWINAVGAAELVVRTPTDSAGARAARPSTYLLRHLMIVKNRMTRDPITVTPDDTLARALQLTRTHRIRHLPVVARRRLRSVCSPTATSGSPCPRRSPSRTPSSAWTFWSARRLPP